MSLSRTYERRLPYVVQLRKKIELQLGECLDDVRYIDHIAGREKSARSFVQKAGEKKYENPFEDMEDQIGIRVYTLFRSSIMEVRECITNEFSRAEEGWRTSRDPRAFGYETHHVILQIPTTCQIPTWPSEFDHVKTFELQIRTVAMHAWAEAQHSLRYKSSYTLSNEHEKQLAAIAALFWAADNEYDRLRLAIEAASSD